MPTHIMLDLETMGTNSNSAIVAIGACVFQPMEMRIADTFYTTVSLGSAMDNGGRVDTGTVCWWMQQGDEARKEIYNGTTHIYTALCAFKNWVEQVEYEIKERRIWGNGADFDNVILDNAYSRLKMSPPWFYRYNRCYRTFVGEIGNGDVERIHEGVEHNALDDAVSQAKHLMEVMNHVRK